VGLGSSKTVYECGDDGSAEGDFVVVEGIGLLVDG